MVEMKNPIKEADAHPEIRHLSLWRTKLAYAWVINCEPGIQDDMHYHENDDHIFKQPYQLCNTGKGRLLLLGAGNAGVNGVPRSRVPDVASHTPVQQPVVA